MIMEKLLSTAPLQEIMPTVAVMGGCAMVHLLVGMKSGTMNLAMGHGT